MAVMELWRRQDLEGMVQTEYVQGNFVSLDADGNLIGVKVYKDGEPVTLSGSVTGYCVLPDGSTVAVAGTRTGNRAYITVPQSALAYVGPLGIVIKLIDGNTITTLLSIVATVYKSRTDNVITPSQQIITDWANAISEALQEVEDASAAQDEKIDELKNFVEPMLDENYVIHPTSIYGNNNTAMTSNGDGSFTAGTTDYGNTTFGSSMTTLQPGDYYLYGVPQGIAFITTVNTGSTSYNNKIFENTAPEPQRFHLDSETSVCLGYRIASAPSSAVTIYPALYKYTPKVDRALLEKNILANNTDLNTVTEPGIYLIDGSLTYQHAPNISNGGILTVYRCGNLVTQTMIQYGTSTRTYSPNLCIRNGTKTGVTSEWKYIGRQYGLKAAMIGDSITWGRNGNVASSSDPGYRTDYQIPDAIAHNLGIVCENMGVSGMGWIKEGDGDVIAYDVLSGLTLSDYDAIFFCLGVNDGFSDLGTWDSEDETTIMGQFNKCIKYIMTNRPTIRVIVIAPFNGRGIGSFPDYWYGPRDNPDYVSRKVLSDTLKQACQYYWLPYIEQYDGPINPYSISTLIGSDGVHPSSAGYLALGQWLSAKIGAVL